MPPRIDFKSIPPAKVSAGHPTGSHPNLATETGIGLFLSAATDRSDLLSRMSLVLKTMSEHDLLRGLSAFLYNPHGSEIDLEAQYALSLEDILRGLEEYARSTRSVAPPFYLANPDRVYTKFYQHLRKEWLKSSISDWECRIADSHESHVVNRALRAASSTEIIAWLDTAAFKLFVRKYPGWIVERLTGPIREFDAHLIDQMLHKEGGIELDNLQLYAHIPNFASIFLSHLTPQTIETLCDNDPAPMSLWFFSFSEIPESCIVPVMLNASEHRLAYWATVDPYTTRSWPSQIRAQLLAQGSPELRNFLFRHAISKPARTP